MFTKAKKYYKEHFIKNMISSTGRMSRKEMQERELLLTLSICVLYVVMLGFLSLSTFLFGLNNDNGMYALAWIFAAIIIAVPLLSMWSVFVRRLHDFGYSGWYLAAGLVLFMLSPLSGFGIFLVLLGPIACTFVFFCIELMPGETRDNKYGKLPVILENDFLDKKENITLKRFKQYLFLGEWKKDYLTFNGRLTCREFFFLAYGLIAFQSIVSSVFAIITLVAEILAGFEQIPVLETTVAIFNLLCIILLYPINVRRNHDFGNSWVWTFLILIPGVNVWYILRQLCFTGNLAENQYGVPRTWIDENGVLRNNDY